MRPDQCLGFFWGASFRVFNQLVTRSKTSLGDRLICSLHVDMTERGVERLWRSWRMNLGGLVDGFVGGLTAQIWG